MEPSGDDLRPFIKRAVVKMAQCARFERAENDALETLVELYGALIQSIAEISREYCEHGNRCIPTIQDIISGRSLHLNPLEFHYGTYGQEIVLLKIFDFMRYWNY